MGRPRSIKQSVYLRPPQMRLLEEEAAQHFGALPTDIIKRRINEHIRRYPDLVVDVGAGAPEGARMKAGTRQRRRKDMT